MRPDEEDAARLWDMLAYAREIVQSLHGRTLADYRQDGNLRLATERRLEIIGEAARHVSDGFQASHASIPWRKIVALRHILVHEYVDVKHEVVFRVASVHVPELVDQLTPLVPSSEKAPRQGPGEGPTDR